MSQLLIDQIGPNHKSSPTCPNRQIPVEARRPRTQHVRHRRRITHQIHSGGRRTIEFEAQEPIIALIGAERRYGAVRESVGWGGVFDQSGGCTQWERGVDGYGYGYGGRRGAGGVA